MENITLLKYILLVLLIFESSLLIVCRDLKSQEEMSSVGLRPKRRLSKESDRVRLLKRLIHESYEFRRNRRRERQRLRTADVFEQEDFDDIPPVRPGRMKAPADTKRYFEVANGGEVPLNGGHFCCPQRFEVIQPSFGRNRTGHMVELFTDERVKQSFHETICQPEFANEPCRFLQGQNYRRSKCVQQHTYTYALVRWEGSVTGWSLDHIRIRSGCACQVMPSNKKKKHRLSDSHNSDRSRQRLYDDDK